MAHHSALPPVTDQHRMHAYAILRPIGVSFAATMQRPECTTWRQVIECKAAQLRNSAWVAAVNTHKNKPQPAQDVRKQLSKQE